MGLVLLSPYSHGAVFNAYAVAEVLWPEPLTLEFRAVILALEKDTEGLPSKKGVLHE